jgi:hypothetical protein
VAGHDELTNDAVALALSQTGQVSKVALPCPCVATGKSRDSKERPRPPALEQS